MDAKHLRNPYAAHAHGRKAGPIKHRCSPRGGSRNVHQDALDEYFGDIFVEDGAKSNLHEVY